jgi:uncharacterized protein (DUF1684 family)
MSDLTNFRQEKDDFFANHPQSPLSPEQQQSFTGLRYYPENPDLIFELGIEELQEQETIQMQTSTGDIQDYIRFGKIHFEIEGVPQTLTVFNSPHGFFIPFVDSNAGKETYGAGRYLDPPLLPNGKIIIDFNHAYNPYCAYNDLYSCPIPPTENRLKTAILAGEKNFK